jgi:nitric oxide reductase NorQ protein
VLKDLKQSTRQRFVALEFDYPAPELERKIVATESGVTEAGGRQAGALRADDPQPQGQRSGRRRLTRLLVHAGKLIAGGIDPVTACRSAVAQAVTDDADMLKAIQELSSSIF